MGNKLQWIAIACTAISLVTTNYHHSHILKAERINSELSSYLHLNERYHKLLFTLLQNDSDVFQKNEDASLEKNKYLLYALFELFSTVDSLKEYFIELGEDVWPCWERRMEFLFSKPAIRYAWHTHEKYAAKIYTASFIESVESICSSVEHHNLIVEKASKGDPTSIREEEQSSTF